MPHGGHGRRKAVHHATALREIRLQTPLSPLIDSRTKFDKTVPKKIKKDSTGDPAPTENLASSLPPSVTVSQPPKRRAPSAKRASTKTAAKKKPASRAKTGAAKQPSKTRKTVEPSDADIQLRAYFIAERRAQLGLHGDQANDWLEAKRQLVEEARAKTS